MRIFHRYNELSVMLRTVCLGLIVLCLFGCKKSSFEGEVFADAGLANNLLQSPTTLQLAQNEVILKGYLWRDFMPVSPADGKPLICVVTLFDVDSVAIAEDLDMNRIYVVHGHMIWMDTPTAAHSYPEYEQRARIDNGPKWGPGIEVDVVYEVVSDGEVYRIRAESQEIIRTE